MHFFIAMANTSPFESWDTSKMRDTFFSNKVGFEPCVEEPPELLSSSKKIENVFFILFHVSLMTKFYSFDWENTWFFEKYSGRSLYSDLHFSTVYFSVKICFFIRCFIDNFIFLLDSLLIHWKLLPRYKESSWKNVTFNWRSCDLTSCQSWYTRG